MGYSPLQYKYRLNTDFPMTDEELYQYAAGSGGYPPEYVVSGSGSLMVRNSSYKPIPKMDLDIEALADKLWEKIYSKPAIIPCPYCKSHNAVTNPTCIQCGGPLGG